MIEKVVQIKNVARFRDYSATGDVTLRKLTLVHADNGRGKTTLCAILRSLATNKPALILERKTLGATDDSSVHLRIGGASTRFQNNSWSSPYNNILVFDPAFVNDNIYSGESVDLVQRRNLYRVIVGEDGVVLARRVDDLDQQIREANSRVRTREAAITGYRPAGVSLNEFLQWQPVPDIDTQIAQKRQSLTEKEIAAAKATEIRTTGLLNKLPLPSFPPDAMTVWAETLANVQSTAEARVRQHMAQHEMGAEGESWLFQGVGYVKANRCPFCEQEIANVELITAYQSHFNLAYRELKARVAALGERLNAAIGVSAMQSMETVLTRNAVLLVFWNQFCNVSLPEFDLSEVRSMYADLLSKAHALTAAKQRSPLEVVEPDAAFQSAVNDVKAARALADAYNQQVDAANASVEILRREAGTDFGISTLRTSLAALEARKKRYDPVVIVACNEYQAAVEAKHQLDADKAVARQALDAHCLGLMTRYQEDINKLLDHFNAGFRLTKSRHVYTGGIPSSQYQIRINNTDLDLGDSGTATGTPCFKTALSSGDRSALALAFFLATAKQDANIAHKVIVFDDPFTSLDRFRRTATQQFIQQMTTVSEQVIVLSHDPFFLKLIFDCCPAAPTGAKCMQISKVGDSSVIGEWDMEEEVRCAYLKDHAVLLAFYGSRAGDQRSVARSIRPFLEGFLRSHYPGHFLAHEWLGDFICRIRDAGPTDGLAQEKPNLVELEAINDYSKKFHHEQNRHADAELINEDELHGYVKRTLRFVGGA